MTTEVLGKLTFSETPDVNGADVLLNAGGVPSILSGTTAGRPAAGTGPAGRIYLDTDANRFYRDDGSQWVDLTPLLLLDGTADEITVIDGTNVTPSIVRLADDPIIPGNQRVRVPVGTTAQRPGAPAPGDTRFNTDIERKETFNGSFWVPEGTVLQVVTGSIPALTFTAQIPFDNTVPTSTEGTQIWSRVFTPISATSRVLVEFTVTVGSSTVARRCTVAVFSGTTNIGSVAQEVATGATTQNLPHNLGFRSVFQPGSTAPITISARGGLSGTGNMFINIAGTTTLGGSLASTYTITELA